MSSGHRLRDVEQHHPLLDGEDVGAGGSEVEERGWFIQDGCGMVCAFVTWFLVLYADFVHVEAQREPADVCGALRAWGSVCAGELWGAGRGVFQGVRCVCVRFAGCVCPCVSVCVWGETDRKSTRLNSSH